MDLTSSVDGTIPIQALLFDDEDLISAQDNVGIYIESTKAPDHQLGVVHLTSHRLFYIDNAHPERYSFALSLSLVTKTEYYAGLFTSSAKISLYLSSQPTSDPSEWSCVVCGYRNPSGLSSVCGLCGVVQKQDEQKKQTCRICTFINDASRTKCEMCDNSLVTTALMKISFRRGGDKPFYNDLKRALLGQGWEITTATKVKANNAPSNSITSNNAGISQILSLNENSQSSTSTSLSNALSDLEALMIKAKEMVHVANDLSERLAVVDQSTLPAETPELLSSFSNLAISKPTSLRSTPVTQEMYKSEALFLSNLSAELSSILASSSEAIIPLDRVWVTWNRARGVSLIPPSTFLDVLPHVEANTDSPYRLRQLGDLKVLYTPQYSPDSVSSRLSSQLPTTPTSFSLSEGITIPLAQLLLDEIELLPHSPICRDDWESAIRIGGRVVEPIYHCNVFKDYEWDGQIS